MSDTNEIFARGSCQCGYITFEVLDAPLVTYACYCAECRRSFSGAQTTSMALQRHSFRLLSGVPKCWERASDAGVRNAHYFCPECGNRIYGDDPNNTSMLRINAYALSGQREVVPEVCFWASSKPDWVVLPDDCVIYDTQEEAEKMLRDIQQLRAKNS